MSIDASEKNTPSSPSLLVLLPAYYRDGTEKFPIIIARSVLAHGWRVCAGIRKCKETESIAREFRAVGADVRAIDICEMENTSRRISFRKRITRVMRLLRREKPDVVLLAVPDAAHGLGPMIGAAIMGIPLISVFSLFRQRQDACDLEGLLYKLLHWRRQRHVILASVSDRLLAEDKSSDDLCPACLPRQRHLVALPDNSACETNQQFALHSRINCKPDAKIILSMGPCDSKSGFDLFAAAIPHVSSAYPETKFVWLGDERNQERMRRLLERYRIGHCVYLLEPFDSTRLMISDADLFVYPMRYSGFPYPVLESIAVGTPVVAVRMGTVPELVTHQKTGLLCDQDDVHDLRENLMYALGHPAEMETMALQARQRVNYWDMAVSARGTVSYIRRLAVKR